MTKKNHPYWINNDNINNTILESRLLPKECANNLGIEQIPDYIIIHEVSLGLGRSPKEYNLEHYAKKIIDDGLRGSKIGYHYLVSDKKIIQFIDDNQCAFHTGTDFNYHSIGIERLICEGIRYPDALHNQAKLAATLMVKWNIPISNVISHKETKRLSNDEVKQCPNRLIEGQYGGFRIFYREIRKCLQERDLFYEILEDVKQLDYQDLLNRKF